MENPDVPENVAIAVPPRKRKRITLEERDRILDLTTEFDPGPQPEIPTLAPRPPRPELP